MRYAKYLKWPLRVALALCAWFVIHCALITIDGFSDSYSRDHPADAEIILGNMVLAKGQPGDVLEKRLQKGLELFQAGCARHIICSGGQGQNEVFEASTMRDWLIARGVDETVITVDNFGKDSYCTAREARRIFAARGWKSALIVSHFTHVSRCKLAFHRFDFSDMKSAHADFAWSDFKAFPHEFFGYYYYVLRRDK